MFFAAGAGCASEPDAFVDDVSLFEPGENAGFGADELPVVVAGPPRGAGDAAGSLDVVSLGRAGRIVVVFDDVIAEDGPGVDLIVFENPFSNWVETGVVSASEDGVEWFEWPCDVDSGVGCAGVTPVYSHPDNGIAAEDPEVAGGDGFDLADVGLPSARYVRVVDSGTNAYDGVTGGFDLDAVAVVNGVDVTAGR